MIKKCSLAFPLLGILPCAVFAQDVKVVLANAARTMGVSDLDTLGSCMYSGSGAVFGFGEARAPNSPWPKSPVSSYRRIIDFYGGGSLETITRADEGGTLRTETLRIPFIEPYGKHGKQYDIWLTPIGFLKRAMTSVASVQRQVVSGRQFDVISFTLENKYKMSGYINDRGWLERTEVRLDHPVLGDLLVEVFYSDYEDFQHGLIFPARIIENQGGYPVLDLTITDAVKNVIAQVKEPLVYAREGEGAGPSYHGPFLGKAPPIFVDELLVSDAVHYFSFKDDHGELRHSVVVEFNDYLVVIEAPLDEAHASAVITEIQHIFGDKPIRYVVNTHAHFDASGGLRTYVAEGATIITQDINKPYLGRVLGLPRTISPDKLSKIKKKILIEAVTEKRTLSDGVHVIELHHVPNRHSEGMLLAYLPKEKLLIESELYTARDPEIKIDNNGHVSSIQQRAGTRYTADLTKAADRLRLDYVQVLGLQGRAAPKSEMLEDMKRKPAD